MACSDEVIIMSNVLPVHVTVVIPTRNEEEAIVDTIRSVPNDGWCEKLDFLIIDGNSTDATRELAKNEGAEVYLEKRKGYGRAYKTGFATAPGDIIVTMDADCTYPGEEVPNLVRKLLNDDLEWITCDRLAKAEDGAMSGMHGFGNWTLSTTARLLFWYGIKDSQSGMWVFKKSILDNEKVRPRHDGMPLSQEFKIRARRYLGKNKTQEISVPYRVRVGAAEINTWGDGLLNLRSLFWLRFGIFSKSTPWGKED
jgi:glycosyltransferase involved in cell wall biosynthesis